MQRMTSVCCMPITLFGVSSLKLVNTGFLFYISDAEAADIVIGTEFLTKQTVSVLELEGILICYFHS